MSNVGILLKSGYFIADGSSSMKKLQIGTNSAPQTP